MSQRGSWQDSNPVPLRSIRNRQCDVPTESVSNNELLSPRCLCAAQHQTLAPLIVAQICLGRDPKILVDVRTPPCVVVLHVGMELSVRLCECQKTRGFERRCDMGERLGWDAE